MVRTQKKLESPYIRFVTVSGTLASPGWPLPPKALEGLDDLGLDDDVTASFLGGNAARVFRINQ
jgi:uncharacterized protein